MDQNRLVLEATERAKAYCLRGVPCQEAVDRAVHDVLSPAGLGQVDLLTEAAQAEPIKAVRETISPWLWILSVVGFGLAILNTQRIAKIYGSWKTGRRALREGILPEL